VDNRRLILPFAEESWTPGGNLPRRGKLSSWQSPALYYFRTHNHPRVCSQCDGRGFVIRTLNSRRSWHSRSKVAVPQLLQRRSWRECSEEEEREETEGDGWHERSRRKSVKFAPSSWTFIHSIIMRVMGLILWGSIKGTSLLILKTSNCHTCLKDETSHVDYCPKWRTFDIKRETDSNIVRANIHLRISVDKRNARMLPKSPFNTVLYTPRLYG